MDSGYFKQKFNILDVYRGDHYIDCRLENLSQENKGKWDSEHLAAGVSGQKHARPSVTTEHYSTLIKKF